MENNMILEIKLSKKSMGYLNKICDYTDRTNKAQVIGQALSIIKLYIDIDKEDSILVIRNKNKNNELITIPYLPRK